MLKRTHENFGDGFIQICEAIKELAVNNPGFYFVYPVHLNPNVQQPVREILGTLPNVHLIAPLQYEDFVFAMKHSYLVLTDSGGVQKEAGPGRSIGAPGRADRQRHQHSVPRVGPVLDDPKRYAFLVRHLRSQQRREV